jgi:malate dehydrogenase
MPFVAIIGAGPLGGALAHKLAQRSRVPDVRLIDPHGTIAAGKALDIAQSAPIESSSTAVTSAATLTAAAGASAIVLADPIDGGEVAGEGGLAIVRQLATVDAAAPLLFAGARQRELMERTVRELHVDRRRVLGAAPAAFESAVRALTAVTMDGSPADLAIGVYGVPPRSAVIAWQAATVAGRPLSSRLAPHQMAAISARAPSLWPPDAYALASAGARVAEALAGGSRRRWTCFAVLASTSAGRDIAAAVPVEIEQGGISAIEEPALTTQERTAFENALAR